MCRANKQNETTLFFFLLASLPRRITTRSAHCACFCFFTRGKRRAPPAVSLDLESSQKMEPARFTQNASSSSLARAPLVNAFQ